MVSVTLLAAFFLASCGGGGDINIAPVTNDTSVNNSNNTTTETEEGQIKTHSARPTRTRVAKL